MKIILYIWLITATCSFVFIIIGTLIYEIELDKREEKERKERDLMFDRIFKQMGSNSKRNK